MMELFVLEGEKAIFSDYSIDLLDALKIDADTNEYRVNGRERASAIAADCTGVCISYPTMVALSKAELGFLAPLIRNVRRETGITVKAMRVVYEDFRPEAANASGSWLVVEHFTLR